VIVLDSSILVGIIRGEEDAEKQLDLLAGEEHAIGTPTLVEARAYSPRSAGPAIIQPG